jgi:phosphopantothenoylcysteine decarboxylase
MPSPNIILAVTGGIAAYKVADLAGALVKEDFAVKVIMTESAKKFITPLTLSTLSRNPVYDDAMEWAADGPIKHIELAKWCDLFVVVPATANTIAKMAQGIADNLLTSTYLALPDDKNVLVCPAMNTRMWDAKQTQVNLTDSRS